MVPILLVLTLVVSIDKASAQGDAVVSVTRSRDGDVYLMLYANGSCEERSCSAILPTLEPGGDCVSDVTLRNQYCPSNGSGQYFLSRRNNVETLAVIGSGGILKVFDNNTGDFEISRIANKNPFNNRTENQLETIGCNVTSVAVIRGNGSVITSINPTGFKIVLDSMNERGIHIQVDEANLNHSREEYDGGIYRIITTCHSNMKVDCVVFKLNGTANFTQENLGVSPTLNRRCHNFDDIGVLTLNSRDTLKTPFTTTEVTSRSTSFWEDPTIQYIMIGSGCGIGVLICIISVLCIGICTLSVKSNIRATTIARRLESRYNATQDEDRYYMNQSSTNMTHNNEPTGNSVAADTPADTPTEPVEEVQEVQENSEDHTYASVDDAQAEVEEVRHKEDTAKKFAYASITFDTFKPSERRPPSYQPELDGEQRRSRLPSFARNYNPAANRIQLARNYEVVSLMHKPTSAATKAGAAVAEQDDVPMEEYDTLKHQERKLTMTSQRNFSISQAEYATDYSQLSQVRKKPKQKLSLRDESANHFHKGERPVPKTRTKFPNPGLHSSYSSVKKSPPPPLPPPYDPRFNGMAREEDHYKVPRRQRSVLGGHYDQPSSLVRVAYSCENLGHSAPQATGHEAAAATSIYDMPSSISPPMARRFEREAQERSLRSLISQDSYVNMSTTQV